MAEFPHFYRSILFVAKLIYVALEVTSLEFIKFLVCRIPSSSKTTIPLVDNHLIDIYQMISHLSNLIGQKIGHINLTDVAYSKLLINVIIILDAKINLVYHLLVLSIYPKTNKLVIIWKNVYFGWKQNCLFLKQVFQYAYNISVRKRVLLFLQPFKC